MATKLERLPSQHELPYDDGAKMESDVHGQQLPLLRHPLNLYWQDRDDFFIGTNMFVYFSPSQVKTHDFKGPDVFVVRGVTQKKQRNCYVLWEENFKVPEVVIELLSESTAAEDRGPKKDVYQNILKVKAYVWCNPQGDEFAGFELKDGKYVPIKPDANGAIQIKVLGLALVRWRGKYDTVTANWLRWATPNGVVLPTSDEISAVNKAKEMQAQKISAHQTKRADNLDKLLDLERLRADEERQRADEERRRANEERQRADEERRRANEKDKLFEAESKRSAEMAALLKKHGINLPKE